MQNKNLGYWIDGYVSDVQKDTGKLEICLTSAL